MTRVSTAVLAPTFATKADSPAQALAIRLTVGDALRVSRSLRRLPPGRYIHPDALPRYLGPFMSAQSATILIVRQIGPLLGQPSPRGV